MENRLIVLKLFLDELGIKDDIETIDDRKRVQKAIYLGQRSGVDIGYRFSWYLMGPYSPSLTRDYYRLAEAIAVGERCDDYELQSSIKNCISKIWPLMNQPETVPLSQEDWLELVASYDYLMSVRKIDRDEALSVLSREKPRLVRFVSEAEDALRKYSLLR